MGKLQNALQHKHKCAKPSQRLSSTGQQRCQMLIWVVVPVKPWCQSCPPPGGLIQLHHYHHSGPFAQAGLSCQLTLNHCCDEPHIHVGRHIASDICSASDIHILTFLLEFLRCYRYGLPRVLYPARSVSNMNKCKFWMLFWIMYIFANHGYVKIYGPYSGVLIISCSGGRNKLTGPLMSNSKVIFMPRDQLYLRNVYRTETPICL